MATSLGNLSLGLEIPGLAALDNLERRLSSLDKAHGAPLKIALDTSAADGGVRRLNESLGQTQRIASQRTVVTVDTSGATRNVQELGRAATEAQGILARLLGGAVLGAGAVLGGAAVIGLAKGFDAVKDSVLGFNASMEQSKIAFSTMLGGAQQADAFLKSLQQFALTTPFAFPELVDAAKRMMALGFSAQQVIPMLTDIGNAVSALGGNAQTLDRVVLALGQMQARGRVAAGEMNQLAEAGIPAWKILAEAMGVTTAQAQKMAEQGKVSADVFIKAFGEFSKQNFGGLMEAQSHTFLGALSNIKDAMQQFLGVAFQPLFDIIRNIAVRLGDLAASGTLQRWAQQAQQVVRALIGTFGELLSVIGTVARGVAGVFGINLPHFSLGGGGDAGAQQAAQVQQVTASTSAATAAAADYSAQMDEAKGHVDGIHDALDGVRDAQAALADQTQAVKQGYEDQIRPLERQLDAINRLSEAERTRAARLNDLSLQEIQIKLAMPDVSAIDAQLDDLKRKKEDLGRFDDSGFEATLAPLQAGLEGYDSAIRSVQDRIADLGQANTKALDIQIKSLQREMRAIGQDRTIERRIEDLQRVLNAPAVDTQGFSNQLIGLQAQRSAGGDASAIDAQFRSISGQMAATITADQQKRMVARTELEQLQERQTIQKRMDEDHRTALESQVQQLEDQRQAIQDANAAQREGLESQLKGLERARRGVEDQVKGIEKARAEAQKAHQQQVDSIDKQITALERQREDLLAPSKAALDRIAKEKEILSLQQQQDDILRKMAAAPIKEKIDELKRAEEDALLPLQRQQQALESQSRALETQLRHWQNVIDKIKEAEAAAKDAGAAGGPATARNFTPAIMGPQGVSPYDEQAAPVNAFAQAIEGLNQKLAAFVAWFGDNVTPKLQEFHQFVVGSVIPALGNLRDGFVEAAGKVKEFYDWLSPKVVDAVKDAAVALKALYDWLQPKVVDAFNDVLAAGKKFTDWITDFTKPLLKDAKDILDSLIPVVRDLAPLVGTNLKLAFAELEIALKAVNTILGVIGTYIDTILKPIVVGLAEIVKMNLKAELDALHLLINDFVKPRLEDLANVIDTVVKPVVQDISSKFEEFKTKLSDIKDWVTQNWDAIGDALVAPFHRAAGKLNSWFNGFAGIINGIADKLNIGDKIHIDIKQIPTFARGGVHQGGPAIVGEEGAELAMLPRGTHIFSHAETMEMMRKQAVDSGPMRDLMAGGMGGPFDWLKDKAKGAWDTASGAVGDLVSRGAKAVVGTAIDALGVPDLPGMLGDLMRGVAAMLKNAVVDAFEEIKKIFEQNKPAPAATGGGDYTGPTSGGLIRPIAGYAITQEFGPASGQLGYNFHTGIDLAARAGTPIWAAANGNVTQAGWNDGYGNAAQVAHGNGLSTLYGHMQQLVVALGDIVRQGQTIGYEGSTGNSTGPHLHFETKENGSAVNPRKYVGFLNGGWIGEPVFGQGMWSGRDYSFAEDGRPERVLSAPESAGLGRGGSGGATVERGAVTIHIHPTPGMSEERVGQIAGEVVADVMIGGPHRYGRQ